MKVYIGADHRGFKLKEEIKAWLSSNGYEFEDCGANEEIPNDDYTDYAIAVGNNIASEGGSKGLLICGSGAGVDITANKIKGVRSSVGFTEDQVKAARNDDDINVLCLSSDFIEQDVAVELVSTFLTTEFSPTENHIRRIGKINSLEA